MMRLIFGAAGCMYVVGVGVVVGDVSVDVGFPVECRVDDAIVDGVANGGAIVAVGAIGGVVGVL